MAFDSEIKLNVNICRWLHVLYSVIIFFEIEFHTIKSIVNFVNWVAATSETINVNWVEKVTTAATFVSNDRLQSQFCACCKLIFNAMQTMNNYLFTRLHCGVL